MIALHEVLGQDLPIRLPNVVLHHHRDVIRHAIAADHLFEGRELRAQVGRVGVQRGVDPALPDLAGQLGKAHLIGREIGAFLHEGRAQQAAVQVVSPGVVGADDVPALALAFQKPHHAMAADIGEAADGAVPAAEGEDRLRADGEGQVVACLGNVCGAPQADPAAMKEALALQCQKFGRAIELGRQRAGLRQGRLRGPVERGEEFWQGARHDVQEHTGCRATSSTGPGVARSLPCTQRPLANPSQRCECTPCRPNAVRQAGTPVKGQGRCHKLQDGFNERAGAWSKAAAAQPRTPGHRSQRAIALHCRVHHRRCQWPVPRLPAHHRRDSRVAHPFPRGKAGRAGLVG